MKIVPGRAIGFAFTAWSLFCSGCLFVPIQDDHQLVDTGAYHRTVPPAPSAGEGMPAGVPMDMSGALQFDPNIINAWLAANPNYATNPNIIAALVALGGNACGSSLLAQQTRSATYSTYACAPGATFPGTETILPLGVLPAGEAVVALNNFDDYAFIAIVPDSNGTPNPTKCVAGNYYAVRFTADGNTKYDAVIDHSGAIATMAFDSLVTCTAPKTETNCSDGWDNDGNFATDCADPACAGTAACPNGACASTTRLSCGDTLISGSTANAGATNAVQAYSCPAQGFAAKSPEFAYQFTAPSTGKVTFTVSDFLDYPMLFVLDDKGTGCSPGNCVAQNYYSTTFNAIAGHNYHLVVDGKSGSAIDYKVSVVCGAAATETTCGNNVDDDGDGQTDCYDPDCKSLAPCANTKTLVASAALACGAKLVHGDSAGSTGTSNFNSYQYANLHLTGREQTYKLAPVSTATPVLVTVNNANSYSVIAVTVDSGSGCDASQTVVQSFYNARFTAQPGTSYCISVEGYNMPSVSFDLSVVCTPPSTESAVTGGCTDKIDNDGNLKWDCADPACASACDQPNNCAPQTTINCNTTLLAGTTVGSPNKVNWYGCAPGQATLGNEYAYKFVAPSTGAVLFTLSNESNYGLVSVLPNNGTCDPYYCSSLQYYSSKVSMVAGQTYYVLVDRPDAGTLTYKLSVVCNPPSVETTCTDNIDNDGNGLIDCADPNCHC